MADPGCLSRIPDPTFFHPGSRIPDPGSKLSPSRIPDPGSSSKNLIILTPKKSKKMVSKLWKIWSGLFIPDPGYGCWLSPIPDPGSRGQKGTQSRILDPGSRIRIRNTGQKTMILPPAEWHSLHLKIWLPHITQESQFFKFLNFSIFQFSLSHNRPFNDFSWLKSNSKIRW